MKKILLSCLFIAQGAACAAPTPGLMPMQPAPSHPAPTGASCPCGGDQMAPDHATGCPCAGHQSQTGVHTCGCGTGEASGADASGTPSSDD